MSGCSSCGCGCGGGKKDELNSQVLVVENLVDYQEKTIVSRMIVEKSTGNVSVFAFDKGQALSEHTSPFDAMVQVLDGKAEFTIAGEPYPVAAGEMLVMPANIPHAVTAVERFKMLLTMIRS
jgi:quercetin dioxygenase-like cupin family protein